MNLRHLPLFRYFGTRRTVRTRAGWYVTLDVRVLP